MRQNGSRAAVPVFAALLSILVGMAVMPLGATLFRSSGLRAALVASELLLVAPALLAVALCGLSPAAGLAWKSLSRQTLLLSFAAGLAFWVGSLGLFGLQFSVWSPPPGYLEMFRRLHEALRPSGALDALASLAAIAVLPAACEELLFRGVVLGSLRQRFGSISAVSAAAAAFALIHVDAGPSGTSLYRVPFAFAVGLGLGALRLQAGSVLAPLAAHALLNAVTFLVAPLTDPPEAELPAAEPAQGALLLVAGVCLSAWLLRRIRTPGPPATASEPC